MRAFLTSIAFLALSTPAIAEGYPFEGTWDCGVAIFSFTSEIYNNGSDNMQITDVASDSSGYILTFADDYQLSVAVNADGTLAWFSPASGDSFTCNPVK
ncbi:hypothetical protein ACSBLW_03545 [Thioclava sp. FR2]|uniref:hypothetical protein n=1 Tax=Thioclava sp. FR2 TaxID=3445780 RepID=UPI003EBF7BE0